MCTYLIVDANSKARKDLGNKLKSIDADCQIQESENVQDALLLYVIHQPKLVFLEVDLKKEDGFELIHNLLELGENPRIALVTSNENHAVKAIRSSVIDYLLKPVSAEDLQLCIKRVDILDEQEQERQSMSELFLKLRMNKRVRINTRVGFEVMKPEDILYCKSDRNYTDIVLLSGLRINTCNTLGNVVQQLPQELFFRVGRSAVVNLNYIKAVNRKDKICELLCQGKVYKLPMSPNMVQKLAEVLV